MAIEWGSIVGGYGRIGIEAVVSGNDTTATVTFNVWFWSKYSVSDTSNTLYFDYNASTASTSRGSKSISTTSDSGGWSTTNQKLLYSTSTTYSKGTSAQTKYCAAKLTNVDRVGGTMTVSTSYSIPKKTSYTVSYNANGGSGAPSSQTKWYGTNLTLSSTDNLTRTGYTFQGWGTSASDTSVDYSAGGTYTSNASITLYAIWKINTWTVSYNANGGSGAPSSQTKTYGTTLKLSTTIPKRTNYNFLGWATTSNGSVVYTSGANYTDNKAITLYAVWELAYWVPKITNLKTYRCEAVTDDNGSETLTANEAGTRYKLSFSWECCQLLGTNPIQAATYTLGSETPVSITINTEALNGTVDIDAPETVDVDTSYSIQVTITDSQNGSKTTTVTLPATRFPIDFKAGGTGVAFGEPASEDGFSVNFDARFRKTVKTSHGDSGKESWFEAERTDTDNSICFGLGSGGKNRGMWARNMKTTSSSGDVGNGWTMYVGEDGFVKSQRAQKVLWSGSYYMTAGHTATLSETIDKQLNGIVLIFSAYSSGTAQPFDWNTLFVPKQAITLHSMHHYTALLAGENFWVVGSKGLYVYNNKIVGVDSNNSSGTSSTGITYNNAYWVLRYVIGV